MAGKMTALDAELTAALRLVRDHRSFKRSRFNKRVSWMSERRCKLQSQVQELLKYLAGLDELEEDLKNDYHTLENNEVTELGDSATSLLNKRMNKVSEASCEFQTQAQEDRKDLATLDEVKPKSAYRHACMNRMTSLFNKIMNKISEARCEFQTQVQEDCKDLARLEVRYECMNKITSLFNEVMNKISEARCEFHKQVQEDLKDLDMVFEDEVKVKKSYDECMRGLDEQEARFLSLIESQNAIERQSVTAGSADRSPAHQSPEEAEVVSAEDLIAMDAHGRLRWVRNGRDALGSKRNKWLNRIRKLSWEHQGRLKVLAELDEEEAKVKKSFDSYVSMLGKKNHEDDEIEAQFMDSLTNLFNKRMNRISKMRCAMQTQIQEDRKTLAEFDEQERKLKNAHDEAIRALDECEVIILNEIERDLPLSRVATRESMTLGSADRSPGPPAHQSPEAAELPSPGNGSKDETKPKTRCWGHTNMGVMITSWLRCYYSGQGRR